jgi:ATP-dependent Clp endopeptidase proteolytic subunit ClpP
MNIHPLAAKLRHLSFDDLRVFCSLTTFKDLDRNYPGTMSVIMERDRQLFDSMVMAFDRPVTDADLVARHDREPVAREPRHIAEVLGRARFMDVQARGNSEADLMLYGTISQWEELNAKDFQNQINALGKMYSKINLRIHSPGGSVYEGFAMCTAILNSRAEVHSYIDGVAASMASVIAICGKRVHMSSNGRMMTHQSSAASTGGADDLRQQADELDLINSQLADMYAARTGKAKQWILDNWMQRGVNKWFTADQAKEAGLVDEIYTGKVPGMVQAQSFEGAAAYFDAMLTMR